MLLLWCLSKIYQTVHPSKRKTKRPWEEVRCPCICLSLPISSLRSHWSIQTLCSFARQTRNNNKDFCSSLTAWPLMFPSRLGGNPEAVNLIEWDQMKHDERPGWSLWFPDQKYTAPFISWSCFNVLEDAPSDLLLSCRLQVNSLADVNWALNPVKELTSVINLHDYRCSHEAQ